MGAAKASLEGTEVAINLNPYQGLKHKVLQVLFGRVLRCNQPKSLSGIETYARMGYSTRGTFCNQPKSLSGIETQSKRTHNQNHCLVAINLNPYQGLKPIRDFKNNLCRYCGVAINLNPYQGLKLIKNAITRLSCPSCNQPKSLSGIETASFAELK